MLSHSSYYLQLPYPKVQSYGIHKIVTNDNAPASVPSWVNDLTKKTSWPDGWHISDNLNVTKKN